MKDQHEGIRTWKGRFSSTISCSWNSDVFFVQGFQALARRVQEHHEYLQASFFGKPYCFLERIQYKSPIGG